MTGSNKLSRQKKNRAAVPSPQLVEHQTSSVSRTYLDRFKRSFFDDESNET